MTYTAGGGAVPGTLTGVTRGVGGTIPQAHSTGTAVFFSEALINGDDLRVWVNDVEVARWPAGLNTTALKLWVNLSMPPATRVRLKIEDSLTMTEKSNGLAVAAANPADGGELGPFYEGVSRLPERGVLAFDDELIAYSGKDVERGVVTGIERGAWGTTAADHYHDPIRGYVNGAVAAGELTINYDSAQHGGLNVGGGHAFLVGSHASEQEEIFYHASTATDLSTFVRGANGTVDQAHADNTPILMPHYGFLVPVLYVVAVGKGKADAGPGPIDRRPAINLQDSRNVYWIWGTEIGNATGDDLTVYYDPKHPDRTAAFTPTTEVPASDENNAALLRLEESRHRLTFEDSDPVAGRPAVSRLTRAFPSGAYYAIYSYQPRSDIRLRILGVDADGNEVELSDHQDVGEAPVGVAGFTVGRFGALQTIILNGARAAVCGNDDESINTIGLDAAGEYLAGRFILDQDTPISGLQVQLRKDGGASSFTFDVEIFDNSHPEAPWLGNKVMAFSQTRNQGDKTNDDTDVTTSFVAYEYTNSSASDLNDNSKSFILTAGTYWIVVSMTARASNQLVVLAGRPRSKQAGFVTNGSVIGGYEALWFRLMHPHGGPVQPEAMTLNAGITASGKSYSDGVEAYFNNLQLGLNGAGWWPYVHRTGGFTNGLYHCVGTIKNTDTLAEIAIDKWMATGMNLVINCDIFQVTYTEGNLEVSCPSSITPTDADDWLLLVPGANNMTYSEDNMVSTDLTTTFRGRKV